MSLYTLCFELEVFINVSSANFESGWSDDSVGMYDLSSFLAHPMRYVGILRARRSIIILLAPCAAHWFLKNKCSRWEVCASIWKIIS